MIQIYDSKIWNHNITFIESGGIKKYEVRDNIYQDNYQLIK
jgi:hypothetical protein